MDSKPHLSKDQESSGGLRNSTNSTSSIYNPFEVDICSLSLPACSPDAFTLTKKKPPEKESDNDESFRWSIGEVAVLKPANIDEGSHQGLVERWDEEEECRAQKAIQTFFLHNSICPSPWNGAMNFKHVTFSPHLASTAYFSRSESSFNVNGDSSEVPGKRNVWTQTTLAVPTEVDIFQLLGQFYTFLEDQRAQLYSEESSFTNDAKDVVNSSLRRKLFSPKSFRKEQSHECGSSPQPISPLKYCTPEKMPHSKLQASPSSAGTYFSSSPISNKKCSLSPCQMECNLNSPSVSPILMEERRSEKMQPKWLPSTPCTKKGVRPKNMQGSFGDEAGVNFEKVSPLAPTLSMTSKPSTEDLNGLEELQMEAEHTRYDSTQNSEMQISVVQFSCDEKACAQLTQTSALHPSSVLSQDTGYKTESYQYSLENGTNVDESKEKMVQNWLYRDFDISEKGTADEIDTFKPCKADTNKYIDSVLMSQSNWHPQEFSTPH